MKKNIHPIFTVFIILFFTVFVSACLPTATPSESSSTPTDEELTQKSGFTTQTGTLSQQGNSFFLQTSSGPITLQSFELDLSEYVGQTVSVTGKYSGDELFVSEIAE